MKLLKRQKYKKYKHAINPLDLSVVLLHSDDCSGALSRCPGPSQISSGPCIT